METGLFDSYFKTEESNIAYAFKRVQPDARRRAVCSSEALSRLLSLSTVHNY